MLYIGVDFGTTNSSIAQIDLDTGQSEVIEVEGGYGEGKKLLRTVLYFQETGEVVAEEALASINPTRSVDSLKRKIIEDPKYTKEIDGKVYPADKLVGFFLSDLFKRAHKDIKEIRRLVLSVPTHYDEELKNLMERACCNIGIPSSKVWFIDEPVAITWDYQGHHMPGELVLVFDFGGGTLDLAVMRKSENLGGVGTAAEILRGEGWNNNARTNWKKSKIIDKKTIIKAGDDLDEVIMRYLIEKGKEQNNEVCKVIDLAAFDDPDRYKKLRENLEQQGIYRKLKSASERIKIQLSEQEEYGMTIPPLHPKYDRVGLKGITMSQTEFIKRAGGIWDIIRKGIQELGRNIQSTAGIELSQIEAVLLSGGSSLIPYVQDLIEDLLPNARIGMDPYMQTSICRGNARYCYHDGEILVEDKVNSAYGIYNHYDKDVVMVINEKDTYPIEIKKRVATTKPNQKMIEIVPMVRKGGDFGPLVKNGSPVYCKMNIKPHIRIRDLARITVSYSIDKSQRLKITAYDNLFKETVGVEEINLSDGD